MKTTAYALMGAGVFMVVYSLVVWFKSGSFPLSNVLLINGFVFTVIAIGLYRRHKQREAKKIWMFLFKPLYCCIEI